MFCKVALTDIASLRTKIESGGVQICLIYQESHEVAGIVLGSHGLADVHRITDPYRQLYTALDLQKAQLADHLRIRAVTKFIRAAIRGKFNTKETGDISQLGGAALIENGKLIHAVRLATVFDEPNYFELTLHRETEP